MSYARITNGTMTHPYQVPAILKTPTRDHDLRSMRPDLLAVHGIVEVVEVARPADTEQTTSDRTVELVNGTPTVVHTPRPKTIAEQAGRYPSAEESAKVAARLVVLPMLAAKTLSDAQVEQLAGLFPDFEPGLAVEAGEVYRHDGTLVEAVQSHTTQADWTPDTTAALWKTHRSPTPTEWVQPIGSRVV